MKRREPMSAVLIRQVPTDLRDQFKAVCARQGKHMSEMIVEYMNREVAAGYLREGLKLPGRKDESN